MRCREVCLHGLASATCLAPAGYMLLPGRPGGSCLTCVKGSFIHCVQAHEQLLTPAAPSGSCLVLKGNGADIAKHCVPAVTRPRISITLRKCGPTLVYQPGAHMFEH